MNDEFNLSLYMFFIKMHINWFPTHHFCLRAMGQKTKDKRRCLFDVFLFGGLKATSSTQKLPFNKSTKKHVLLSG